MISYEEDGNTNGSTSYFQAAGSQGLQMYGVTDDVVSPSLQTSSSDDETQLSSLLYSLSTLKDKVHQMQSLVNIFISPDDQGQPESLTMSIANIGTLIQEVIVTASSMMFTCQQMALFAAKVNQKSNELHQHLVNKAPDHGPSSSNHVVHHIGEETPRGFFTGEPLEWYGDHSTGKVEQREIEIKKGFLDPSPKNYDIIELDVEDLLAKYTHYCQICGKGFKRDANLRMHMRAHGDEYKTIAALSNPMKNNSNKEMGYEECSSLPRKYSCPHEGCRWNKNHVKFQPLKSKICAKNHYRRSHCPKMYVCKRCNQKQFSVLSDLRTHEKHCGDRKWQCSCGTNFSRKDKLMGHVSLFIGHTPVDSSLMKPGN